MMLAALVAGLLPFAGPWDKPAPLPKKAELVLTHPQPPDPPPEGSVIDVPADRELPEKWRTSEKADARAKGNPGLIDLHASGSGQFCREQFYALRGALKDREVIVVDLREEPHTFLDGAALTWGPPDVVGANRSAAEIERTEQAWTEQIAAGKFVMVTQYAGSFFADTKAWIPMSLKLDIREAIAEARLVTEAHWRYFRIAAPDTIVPRDQDVDRFVTLVSDIAKAPPWLHFHCDTGGNRTTLFLTLYDMMRNYAIASRPAIIERQRKLGGYNLLAGPHKAERATFLEQFYSYCWQCGPLFRRSWSSWNRAQLRKGD